jgi:hypothetical protein
MAEVGEHRSTKRSKMGMRPSRDSSFLRAATSIFRTRIFGRRSTFWPSRRGSWQLAVKSTFRTRLGARLHIAAYQGHAHITKQLLAARCKIDFLDQNGRTALLVAELQGHTGIATLIRNKKQEILETALLGRRVVINGLVAKPELNGRTGTAVSFDDDKGRYSVELDDTSSFMIKPCNLLPTVYSVALCSLLFSYTLKTLPRLS